MINPFPDFLTALIISFGISAAATYVIRRVALRYNIVDKPNTQGRKLHEKTTPLLGGMAVFCAFALTTVFFWEKIITDNIMTSHLVALLLATMILVIGGYFDDKYNLKPQYQLFFSIAAVILLLGGGISIEYIRNPFGDLIWLDGEKIHLFSWGDRIYSIALIADIFLFFWVLGMSYSTKLLDGLDGLVSGITVIGALILFFLSITKEVNQPNTALLAMIVAGAFAGFLVWNAHPAKIFLGEGGSLLAGFLLATLAIIGGAKVASALLIMGIPALDMAWVIIRRFFFEKKNPFRSADRRHLHFRLLDAGFSHRAAVYILYALTAVFGVSGLFLKGKGKFFAFAVVVGTMLLLGGWLVKKYQNRKGDQALDRKERIQ